MGDPSPENLVGDCPTARISELSNISPDLTPCRGNHLGSPESKSAWSRVTFPRDLSLPSLSASNTSTLKTFLLYKNKTFHEHNSTGLHKKKTELKCHIILKKYFLKKVKEMFN